MPPVPTFSPRTVEEYEKRVAEHLGSSRLFHATEVEKAIAAVAERPDSERLAVLAELEAAQREGRIRERFSGDDIVAEARRLVREGKVRTDLTEDALRQLTEGERNTLAPQIQAAILAGTFIPIGSGGKTLAQIAAENAGPEPRVVYERELGRMTMAERSAIYAEARAGRVRLAEGAPPAKEA